MGLRTLDEHGVKAVEGQPGEPFLLERRRRAACDRGMRLAVVCPPGSVDRSSRFNEMVAEERHGRYFGLFETRADALDWLAR